MASLLLVWPRGDENVNIGAAGGGAQGQSLAELWTQNPGGGASGQQCRLAAVLGFSRGSVVSNSVTGVVTLVAVRRNDSSGFHKFRFRPTHIGSTWTGRGKGSPLWSEQELQRYELAGARCRELKTRWCPIFLWGRQCTTKSPFLFLVNDLRGKSFIN